ncbi:sialic acid-binding Ig-like lectin 11 [Mytilus trossulus]|uniref:sialic acid-binding Ig-like lectin 11 n=1 Tax=Mytilus trossulus TaxID=6551 RepID=UPI003005CA1E
MGGSNSYTPRVRINRTMNILALLLPLVLSEKSSVAPKDVIILNKHTDGIISQTEGQMLNITCQAIGGNTKGNISWINVSDISSNFTELIKWPFVYLSFTTDYKHHRKKLACGVAHALLSGHMEESVTINVLYRPKISIKRHPVNELTEGQQIKLECLDTSNPSKTNITWEKSGIILSSKPIYEKNNIDTNDSGIYICIVFNSLGHEQENISILVNKRKDTYNSDSSTGIGPLEVVMIYVCVCSCGTLLFCLAAFVLPKCRRVSRKPTALGK